MATKTVYCVVLKEEAEALDVPPYPGELGYRILENVSKEGWRLWLERLIIIINENGLNSADKKSIELLEKHMLGFSLKRGIMARCQLDSMRPGVNSLPELRYPVRVFIIGATTKFSFSCAFLNAVTTSSGVLARAKIVPGY
jgi:Fe-S cluster biosynthesis and repair protein YggX